MQVAKVLKTLVSRLLVKAVKTVNGIQKVYMLYELEPGTFTLYLLPISSTVFRFCLPFSLPPCPFQSVFARDSIHPLFPFCSAEELLGRAWNTGMEFDEVSITPKHHNLYSLRMFGPLTNARTHARMHARTHATKQQRLCCR
jgi:hypothetical protein